MICIINKKIRAYTLLLHINIIFYRRWWWDCGS